MGIFTGARTPLPTLAELVKQAKVQKIFYGTGGTGSASRFAAELLNDVAGIKMEQVNHKGAGEALVDIAGGRLDVYIGAVGTVVPTLGKGGIVPVAIAGPTIRKRCRRPRRLRNSAIPARSSSCGGASSRPAE
jgi:tripartite-type tricarboxylate transporter receptor subunit TctC